MVSRSPDFVGKWEEVGRHMGQVLGNLVPPTDQGHLLLDSIPEVSQ